MCVVCLHLVTRILFLFFIFSAAGEYRLDRNKHNLLKSYFSFYFLFFLQLGSIEEEVRLDRNKQQLIKLQAEKMTLQERVAKLEKEVNKPVLSEAEMREQLLEQVFFFLQKKSRT